MARKKKEPVGLPKERIIALLDDHFDTMRHQLQVGHWALNVLVEPIKDFDTVAEVHMFGDYDKATITIDPRKHHSDEDVLRSLRHEMLHLHLNPVEIYSETMGEMLEPLDESGSLYAAEQRLRTHAIERMVLNLERMLDHGFHYQPWVKLPFVEEKLAA